MAELILTEEEKSLPFWNDLDDVSLGRVCKRFGIHLALADFPPETKEKYDMEGIMMKAAIIGMCNFIAQAGATEYVGKITGLQDEHGNSHGDWEISYRRVGI